MFFQNEQVGLPEDPKWIPNVEFEDVNSERPQHLSARVTPISVCLTSALPSQLQVNRDSEEIGSSNIEGSLKYYFHASHFVISTTSHGTVRLPATFGLKDV